MIDRLIPTIEQVRAEGAIILVKWDGERAINRCTIVITRRATEYIWREDTDDIPKTLEAALADYRLHHPRT